MPTYNDYDLNMVNDRIKPIVHVKQYDNNNRVIRFTLYNGDEAYSVPASTVVTCRGLKKSGNAFSEACSYSGNVVSVVVTTQMSVVSGRVPCELRLTKGTTIIGSMNFYMDVEENPIEDAVIEDDEMTTVEQIQQDVTALQTTKLDAPSVAGTQGQVLSLDANLNPIWATVSGGGAVTSVNGQTGTVVLDADDVGATPAWTNLGTTTLDASTTSYSFTVPTTTTEIEVNYVLTRSNDTSSTYLWIGSGGRSNQECLARVGPLTTTYAWGSSHIWLGNGMVSSVTLHGNGSSTTNFAGFSTQGWMNALGYTRFIENAGVVKVELTTGMDAGTTLAVRYR